MNGFFPDYRLTSQRRYARARPWLGLVVLSILLVVLRWLFPERPVHYTGPRALLDAGFALGLLGVMLLLAGGLGWKLLRRLRLKSLTPLEQALFGLPLGLGVIAYGVLALGLAGLLRPWALLLWLILLSVLSWRDWSHIADKIPVWLGDMGRNWRATGLSTKLLVIVMGLILILTLFQALAPPTDPDGLIDHLQAPKQFLKAGRLYPAPEFEFANYPFTVESLFTLGMAFGSDTFAKLIHLAYGCLLVLATFAFGRRYLPPGGGRIAAAILVGMPIMPIWAGLAYIDLGWTLYEFLGIYAVVLWAAHDQRRWVILAGLMIGLALGSKYLAFGGAAAIGLWIVWHAWARGGRTRLASAVLFGGAALLVASPWFIKNWWWLGSPVYPYFGGTTATQLANHTTYGILDYLILPWHLYVNRAQFVGVYGGIEFPSIFFLLVFLYPWTRRPRAMDGLAGMTLLRYIFWALISHGRFRYLLPAMPGLSLLASSVVLSLTARPSMRRWGQVLTTGLLGGMLATTLVYSLLFFADVQPFRVVSGTESKDNFLRREVSDYAAKQFVQANLPPEARVFMPWDARGYYCDARCLPDLHRKQWVDLTTPPGSPASVAARLREMNVTHLLFSIEDVDYTVMHDASGLHRQAARFFVREFRMACTREIYGDEWASVYELTCK